jgi:hypothetical protein
MKRPDEPLFWPAHYPPTDPVKKFFIGIRWLGPDLSFFKELRDQQAARVNGLMACWPTNEEHEVALIMGKHFQRSIGWKTPFFLPNDRFIVIAYGPRFQSMDAYVEFEESVADIKKDLQMDSSDGIWQQIAELAFQDAERTFQDVVRILLKKKDVT